MSHLKCIEAQRGMNCCRRVPTMRVPRVDSDPLCAIRAWPRSPAVGARLHPAPWPVATRKAPGAVATSTSQEASRLFAGRRELASAESVG